MKFLLAVAAAAACVATVNAQGCTGTDTEKYAALSGVIRGPIGMACTNETGYSVVANGLGPPTAAQYPAVCPNASCQKFLAEMKNQAPKPCSVLGIDIYLTIIDKIDVACAPYYTAAPTTAPPTTTPVITTQPPASC